MTVVVATRNRRELLLGTLRRLTALPEAPRVVVVDNGSEDGSVEAVLADQPEVHVIALRENRGAAARTAGVQAATTPYVAFSDDDSWWRPGALRRGVRYFDTHPRLGLLAARILVGPEGRLDPISAEMARSPLWSPRRLPGPPVLGFAACGALVRRRAYLQVGGFNRVLFFLGEERLLALDLAAAGWDLAYASDVVAHHHPAHQRSDTSATLGRRAQVLRNDLLTAWMRRPLRVGWRASRTLAVRGVRDRDRAALRGLGGALRRAPAALMHRRRLPIEVEQQMRSLSL